MNIYIAHNLDGVNRAMVIAPNLKEAARRFGASVRDLRAYGWHKATEDERKEMMAIQHSHVLFRPIDYEKWTFWRVSRWTNSEVKAIARRCG